MPDWHFDVVSGHKALLDQLAVATLTGFGADGLGAAFGAAGALLRYAQSTQGRGLQHVQQPGGRNAKTNSSASTRPPAATWN